MKVYKERQFLIFDFEDGKTVKYDFATKECIGKKGKPVKNLCSQLSGFTINDVIDNCVDENYAKFISFVKRRYYDDFYRPINNLGTILDKIPMYAKYEQIFSAGINDIVDCRNFAYTINDIPKALIKLCRNHKITLSNDFLKYYKKNPDGYQLAYKQKYISLTDNDINDVLHHSKSVKEYYGTQTCQYNYVKVSTFNELITEYGYTVKGLTHYLDYLVTYEALNASHIINEIYDYASMMKEISNKFDKYPKHFLTTHKIASRNYNRLKQEFKENEFKNRINKDMEKTLGEYRFIYPTCTQDIKDEAVAQNNCVISYIQKVIDGQCHILFLRHKDRPNESLVTIEVRDNKIVQALQKYNHPLTKEQKEVVEMWNKWYANKLKNKEKENERKESED